MRVLSTLVALGLGLVLRGPALGGGLASDDYVQAAMLEDAYPSERSWLDLYDFADGSAPDRQRLLDAGALPWWSAPDLRLAMMRPLTSALVAFDHALFRHDLLARHLHSALWWVLAVLAVGALLHALLPPGVAALALLLFALEEGHSMPFGWLANRGALLALAAGVVAVHAHVRFRRDGWSKGRFVSLLALTVALASGEWALPLVGYLVAYELFGTRDSQATRARSLVPALALVLAFEGSRALLGYGTRDSGVYVDPLADPARFLAAGLERVPVFAADLVLAIPSFWWDFGSPWRAALWETGWIAGETWNALPGWRSWHVVLGVVATLVLVALARWSTQGASDDTRRGLRWLLAGAALSLVPMIGSFPHSRLVLPASIAVSAVSALVIVRAIEVVRASDTGSGWRRLAAGVLLVAVVFVQVFEAGRTSRLDAQTGVRLHAAVGRWALGAELGPEVAGQRVILVSTLEHTLAFFTPFVRRQHAYPVPRAFWTLSAAPFKHAIYRVSPEAIDLEALGGTFVATNMERLYRADELPFRVGDRVALSGMDVEILDVEDGRPRRVRFRFERSLDDPSYVVLGSTRDGLRRVQLPAVGERIELAGPAFPHF